MNRWINYLSAAGLMMGLTLQASGQTASFSGIGNLGTDSRCKGVSEDGSVAVGYTTDGGGLKTACLWTSGGGLVSIGTPNVNDQSSEATDVGITSIGEIKICGTSKDSGGAEHAFLWTGDAGGTGAFFVIPPLKTGGANRAFGLLVSFGDEVYVTGDSESNNASTNKKEAYRWRSSSPAGSLALGFLNGSIKESRGYGIGYRNGMTNIVGFGQSTWGGGANAREAAKWEPSEWLPDKGLTWICGGEGWQIAAGANGVADTTATLTDLQITPPGTTGLASNHVVVSAGADNVMKEQTNPAGDDVELPAGSSPSGSESLYNAVSPGGRYRVGRSHYIGGGTLFEANLRDVRNRDYSDPDNCGGIAFHWPLGFLAGDNYSEAFGVSDGTTDTSRNGLTVVGFSTNSGGDNIHEAFICRMQNGPDIWFLRQAGAAPEDYGAEVASQFKGMERLQDVLSTKFGLDLTGWELRDATAVSDAGYVIVGWGIHNGVEEGFVTTVPALPSQGACCHLDLTCDITYPGDCDGEWLGADALCTRCCPKPFSDSDQDGDVDMIDFAAFQRCMTVGGAAITEGCECFDYEGNGTIDETDLIHGFITCGSGAGIPAPLVCD